MSKKQMWWRNHQWIGRWFSPDIPRAPKKLILKRKRRRARKRKRNYDRPPEIY